MELASCSDTRVYLGEYSRVAGMWGLSVWVRLWTDVRHYIQSSQTILRDGSWHPVPIFHLKKMKPEKLSHLPKVTQVRSGRAGTQTRENESQSGATSDQALLPNHTVSSGIPGGEITEEYLLPIL